MKMFKHMIDNSYQKFKIPFTNLYLIRWYPNASSKIHYHQNIECNFLVLSGKLQENVYNKLNDNGYYMVNSKILKENQSSHINNSIGEHIIKNLSDTYSWSLHYYK